MQQGAPKIRVDKWLWHARFFKTRSLAARQVSGGHVRINGDRATKPAQTVAAGDVLTFAQSRQVRVVRVLALGERRGPPPEAQALYEDLSPPDAGKAQSLRAGERPTKKDRRALDALRKAERGAQD